MEDLNQLRPEQESGAKKPAPDDVDALLQDVKSLLGETDADIAAEAPAEPDAEDSEPITADDVQIDYGKFYGPEEPGQSKIPLTYYEQSKPAYQRARRAEYERVREQERLARAERQQALSRDDTSRVRQARTGKKHEKPRKNAAEYAEWLYSQGLSAEEQQARQEQEEALAAPAGRGRKKQEKPKRHTGLRILAVLVLLLAILTAAFHFLIASQPEAENALSARKPGTSTILVAGTDEGGYRTDSMMLVNVDRTEKTISLVSIPRDTLIYCEYSVP